MELLYIKSAFIFLSLITFVLITNPLAFKRLIILVVKRNISNNSIQNVKK